MIFAISMSLVNLALYCVQQFGITIAVGAETILLVAYLQSIRDGVVDDSEQKFSRAAGGVKDFGLALIITSGAGVVALQFLNGQLTEFLSVVVLFKWSLIGIVLFLTFITRSPSLVSGLLQGLSAGTWYALFAVHILAPAAPWFQMATFYGIWLVGFAVCWTVLVFGLRGKKAAFTPAAPRPSNAIPQAAVVIRADTPKPTQKDPSSGAPLTAKGLFASAPTVSPKVSAVTEVMPKVATAGFAKAIPTVEVPAKAPISMAIPTPPPAPPKPSIPNPPPAPMPSIPKPPMPVAPPVAPIAPLAPPPAPPAPSSVAPTAPVNTPPAEWLHVMPRTPEDLAKRKDQAA